MPKITKQRNNNSNNIKQRFRSCFPTVLSTILVISILKVFGIITTTDCSLTVPSDTLRLASQHQRQPQDDVTRSTTTRTKTAPSPLSYQVPDSCKTLAKIRSSGSILFQNPNCYKAASKSDLQPSYHVGTFFSKPEKIPYHMGGLSSFELIKEHLLNKYNYNPLLSNDDDNKATRTTTTTTNSIYSPNAVPLVTFDVGANQGFFTYFLAALGLEVHAFEINAENFQALQHGMIYNPPSIADHVHLYSMGLSHTIGRFGISGGDYRGYLKETPNVGYNYNNKRNKKNKQQNNNDNNNNNPGGSILSVSMDCFAYHRPELFERQIAFVKIDVEGFEIQVLQGAQQSLFSSSKTNSKQTNVGSLLIEVGPSRWSRSGVTLEDGIAMLQRTRTYFDRSHVLFRERRDSGCPGNQLKEALSSSSFVRVFHDVEEYKVEPNDWKPLLEKMNTIQADCDFWFTNS